MSRPRSDSGPHSPRRFFSIPVVLRGPSSSSRYPFPRVVLLLVLLSSCRLRLWTPTPLFFVFTNPYSLVTCVYGPLLPCHLCLRAPTPLSLVFAGPYSPVTCVYGPLLPLPVRTPRHSSTHTDLTLLSLLRPSVSLDRVDSY